MGPRGRPDSESDREKGGVGSVPEEPQRPPMAALPSEPSLSLSLPPPQAKRLLPPFSGLLFPLLRLRKSRWEGIGQKGERRGGVSFKLPPPLPCSLFSLLVSHLSLGRISRDFSRRGVCLSFCLFLSYLHCVQPQLKRTIPG